MEIRSKQLVKAGAKPCISADGLNSLLIKPTFNEFLEAFQQYWEMQIIYKSRLFGLVSLNAGNINFYEEFLDGSNKSQKFLSIEDFKNNATIDGHLLKDIWGAVEEADYM